MMRLDFSGWVGIEMIALQWRTTFCVSNSPYYGSLSSISLMFLPILPNYINLDRILEIQTLLVQSRTDVI